MIRLQNQLSLLEAKECSIDCSYDITYSIFNLKRKNNFPHHSTAAKRIPSNLKDMPSDNHHRSTSDLRRDESPVAPLCNLGNTCYLNSVLYTLRFTPSFLHNLHHLIYDLSAINSKNQTKAKSSSLGRNITGLSGSSSRSPSTKDLLSMGGLMSQDVAQKNPMQIVTEKLHDVFVNLHNQEEKNSGSAYEPKQFLQAVREVNEIFEGNQQQDAHELLVCLLDNVRSTCEILVNQLQEQAIPPELAIDTHVNNATTNNSKMWGVRKSWKKNKDKESGKKIRKETLQESINEETIKIAPNTGSCNTDSEDISVVDGPQNNTTTTETNKKKSAYNFVVEDFEGIAVRRTKCLECEEVTERKEFFYDICVPVPRKDEPELFLHPNEIYRISCVTVEKLCDADKYWCENCHRYNEARREITYERLPNIMIMQLKRFSTNSGGTEKVNSFLPTPLKLSCFCDHCYRMAEDMRPHSYQLCSIIMHIGSTMAHGHYIAYTRMFDQLGDYRDCSKGCSRTGHSGSGSTNSERSLNIFNWNNKFQFLKTRNNSDSVKNGGIGGGAHLNGTAGSGGTSCKSKDCCGIKLNKPVVENAANNSMRMRDYGGNGSGGGPMWLECDDENVKAISSKELEELLSYKSNSSASSTPYLLFYVKTDDSTSTTTTTTSASSTGSASRDGIVSGTTENEYNNVPLV